VIFQLLSRVPAQCAVAEHGSTTPVHRIALYATRHVLANLCSSPVTDAALEQESKKQAETPEPCMRASPAVLPARLVYCESSSTLARKQAETTLTCCAAQRLWRKTFLLLK
jgi:hypothetical protein